jgi:glycogen debranching enzyme
MMGRGVPMDAAGNASIAAVPDVQAIPDEVRSREAHFFVPPSASIQERLPRALKSGDAFALLDTHGDAMGAMHGPEGVYYRDTRHLSYWRLTMCGTYPMLLGSSIDERVDALIVDLTNSDIVEDDAVVIPNDSIHINRATFLFDSCMHERIAVRNFDEHPHRLSLELTLGCDFQDMFEIRGDRRARRGEKLSAICTADSITQRYRGLDGIERTTEIRFQPAPRMVQEHRVEFELELAPGERRVIFCQTSFDGRAEEAAARSFGRAYRRLRERRRGQQKLRPVLSSSNPLFDVVIDRSISDIATLTTDTEAGSCIYAGIPWYCTLFGRDSLITALELLWYDPSIARGTLLRLAELQAHQEDPAADAEPGKILHEMRFGEMANLREVPFGLYYGSVDSTPLFVYLAGEYYRRTGDHETIEALWPHITAALGWLDNSGDRDGDGFFEYGARTGEGLRNQGWKDSFDAISHADGRLADGPIAVVEMQAYAYGAWLAAAEMCSSRGESSAAREWQERASDLRRRFDEVFFDPEMGTYILALDGEKKPCRVVSSNAGHALTTGIALPDRAEMVVRRLMAPDCFSGWGIRTLGQREKRYNPMSYHNGSVWPHDNALIAAGFSRYGFQREASRLFSALFDAATHFDENRIPELFCGFSRKTGRGPTLYPVACAPQAWSCATPLFLLQATLGLKVNGCNAVDFQRPCLPDFLSKLSINGLRCGNASVDMDIQQMGEATSVFTRNRRGDMSVTTSS